MPTHLTKNFTREELQCKCGCGLLPPMDEVERLQRVRTKAGFAFPVNSAARCPEYNDKVSSTGRDGPHTKGAFDIGLSGGRALRLIELALAEGFTGIGVKQAGPYAGRFIHLDALPNDVGQPRPHIWSYT